MLNEEQFETQMKRQACWLQDLRTQLLRKANLRIRTKILDVGCGSGIITKELSDRSHNTVIGVDNNPDRIERLKKKFPEIDFIHADALNLPFENNLFDLIVTSQLWLWIKDIKKFAGEIKRLLKPNGVYISLSEFDHAARVDFPIELEFKKQLFIDSLIADGADPFVARKLRSLFTENNLNTSWGAFCSMFDDRQLEEDFDKDWEYIKTFKEYISSKNKLDQLYEIEKTAIENKIRFVFMPVFWLYVVKT